MYSGESKSFIFLPFCLGQLEVLDLSNWTVRLSFGPQVLDFVTRVRREIILHGWKIHESDFELIQEKLDKTNSKVIIMADGQNSDFDYIVEGSFMPLKNVLALALHRPARIKM